MKLAVRYLFISLLLIVSFALVKSPAFAQTQQTQPTTANSYAAPNTNPDVPNNLHNWTQNIMIEVMSAMTCQLMGIDPTNPSAKCLGVDAKTNKIGFVENGGGAIGLMSNLISMTFTSPIHTSDYIAYLSGNFGIAKHAYAADCDPAVSGIGFCGLSPLMTLWAAFRNIVYLIFIVIFVIIGLAIMLRVKIDPRTVMTVQNQIPKLIIGILLVTFSFAIAGFLIDIMYITIYLITTVLATADSAIMKDIANITQSTNPFDAATAAMGSTGIGGVIGNSSDSVGNIVSGAFDNPMGHGLFGLIGTIIGAVIGGKVGGLFEGFGPVGAIIGALVTGITTGILATQIAGLLAKFIALLIIAIAVLWSLFKLWFILLEAYIMILLHTVLAPFWIITGLLPGMQSAGFGAWLREILANLAVFPTTIVILLLGRIFIDSFGTSHANRFVPPLMGSITTTNAVGALIGLGIIFLLPNAATITKAMFKAPKIDLGPIGKAVGAGPRVLSGGFGTAMSLAQAKYYFFPRTEKGTPTPKPKPGSPTPPAAEG